MYLGEKIAGTYTGGSLFTKFIYIKLTNMDRMLGVGDREREGKGILSKIG